MMKISILFVVIYKNKQKHHTDIYITLIRLFFRYLVHFMLKS